MDKITQTSRYRQCLIEYAYKHGVTAAAERYGTNRQYIYRWQRRYNGTLESLRDRSRRPHSHPSQHTEHELKLIGDMRRRNPHAGLIVFWVKLRLRGYTRSVPGLFRVLRRIWQLPNKPPNPKYIPKPYEQMTYPGQRVQIDVKHVPRSCLPNGERLYQYTAIDEYSRLRYLGAYEECSTYTSAQFLQDALAFFRRHGFAVDCVQTDNGPEFTRRFSNGRPTLFEQALHERGVVYKRIRPYTPRHNGKVERSHRKDNEYFYAIRKFYSFDDFAKQLSLHNRWYNRFPMKPLAWRSPLVFLRVTHV